MWNIFPICDELQSNYQMYESRRHLSWKSQGMNGFKEKWSALHLTALRYTAQFLTRMLLVPNQFGHCKMMQKTWKLTETLAHVYSCESTPWKLSNEYQHDSVKMVFKNLGVLVLWTKVASALELEGLMQVKKLYAYAVYLLWVYEAWCVVAPAGVPSGLVLELSCHRLFCLALLQSVRLGIQAVAGQREALVLVTRLLRHKRLTNVPWERKDICISHLWLSEVHVVYHFTIQQSF